MTNDIIDEVFVHTEQKDLTLSQLREMVDANDIIVNPDYQRNYVYDKNQASKLIESILIGIPIPVIYLCEEDEGIYSVIDGQQRITSFVRYLKNEFALCNLKELVKINGQFYRDLDKSIQRRLNAKALKAICLNRDSQELKYEIFARLNLGAVKLRDQELRNCLYRGSFNDMLKDIAENNTNLAHLFHDENKRGSYEERILRFFALRNYLELNSTYKKCMNKYMEKHRYDNVTEIQKAKSQYNELILIIRQILGDDCFFSISDRKKFNGAAYDSIIIPFSYFAKNDLIRNSDKIREAIENVRNHDDEYKNCIYAGTNAGYRVRIRMEKIMKAIRDAIGTPTSTNKRLFSRELKEDLFYDGCVCSYCGNKILSINDCEVDHIIPYSKGGETNIENAQLLHITCNHIKSNKTNDSIVDFDDDSEDE